MPFDPIGIDHAVDDLTEKTLPAFTLAMAEVVNKLEKLLERIDGATITIKLKESQ